MSEEEEAKHKLLEWASSNVLRDETIISLSDDGTSLLHKPSGRSFDGQLVLKIETSGKTCQYSLASIFLQIKDPDQSLMNYRNACKKYNISDPVKALDKAIMVAFFAEAGGASASAQPAETATAADGAGGDHDDDDDQHHETAAGTAADDHDHDMKQENDDDAAAERGVDKNEAASAKDNDAATKEKRVQMEGGREGDKSKHHKHREDRHHKHREERHKSREDRQKGEHRSSKDKRDRDHHHREDRDREHRKSSSRKEKRPSSSEDKAGKKKKQITQEQLMDNLNVVVDKRTKNSQQEQRQQEEITKALSTEGFSITPDLIKEFNDVTENILSNEIPVGNSASILRAVNPQKNLSRVLELYLETVEPKKNPQGGRDRSKSPMPNSGGGGSMAGIRPNKSHLIGKKPVIIVPKGMTTPITLINAHEFFCNGRFVERTVMIKQGRHRNPPTTFSRTVRGVSGGGGGRGGGGAGGGGGASSSGNAVLEYEILDNPRKLGHNMGEWDRIVAVIVLGQSWQFKDWPPPFNDPVQLFSRSYGFFISMEGDKLPQEIMGWAVKQAKLNRDKRGMDSITYTSFWNGLDEWMGVHRRELLPHIDG